MDIDYAKWVADVLARKPHLNQSGLARHLGRHRAVITNMVQGKRRFLVSELDQIAAYLGEAPPGQRKLAETQIGLPFGGRIDRAWREPGDAAHGADAAIAPVLSQPPANQIWFAVDVATPCQTILAGDVLVCVRVEEDETPQGRFLVVQREKAGLANLALATRDGSRLSIGGEWVREKHKIIAAVIEIRRRVG